MLHIPILRHGKPYESIEKITLRHHATGQPLAEVSQANPGLIVRDIHRLDDTVLEGLPVAELIAICRRAADRFIGDDLPIGDSTQSFDDYVRCLSTTTGMPVAYCRSNAQKIYRVMAEMHTVIAGLTRGLDLAILDRGFGEWHETQVPSPATADSVEPVARAAPLNAHTLSFFREGRVFGAVLPSNSPGVHGLWIPAIPLKAPIVLKPGREEPWTPLRIIEALAAEGIPRQALNFYPTDHAGAAELLRTVHRAMLFGDASTTRPWQGDPRVEIHGPGYSKVLLGDDVADDWERYLDVMESSIAANAGRSCINASGIWTPRHGRAIAEALAMRLAKVQALPVEDPQASIAAFASAEMARRISAMIDGLLQVPGAVDVTEKLRRSSRLVRHGGVAYLLPTILWCQDREHPLANREFLFPFASVVECPTEAMPAAIGRTLVVSAITRESSLIRALMNSGNVDRLNLGAIPTFQISWDQPHEGNLFTHLYRQRSFQMQPA